MLEVQAGKYKGKKLLVAEKATVPTKNRVREALFDILGQRLDARVFLDLFAGSGAVAVEALSRGAEAAYLVDSSPAAYKIILSNIRGIERANPLNMDFREALKKFREEGLRFDDVFLDPPYKDFDFCFEAIALLKEYGLLSDGYRILIEGEGKPSFDKEEGPGRVYHYGRTFLALYRG